MAALDAEYYRIMTAKQMSNIQFNEKQNEAYSMMVNRKSILITGPGGVGKTAVIKIFRGMYQHHRKIAITSTTGTSAILLKGTTLHSYLGIGYGDASVERLVGKIEGWSWLRKRWWDLECLIIDEISMLDPDLFDKLEEVARRVRKSIRPFGGIQLILSGDFLQLPCVGTDKFCFEAESWDKCVTSTVYLTEIIRQCDKVFQSCLNNVRIANVNNDVIELLESRKGVVLTNEYGIKPTKLYPTNYDVDRINDIELDKLAEDGRQFYEYEMDIKVLSNVSNKQAAIEKFVKNCTAPKDLQLCLGSQVMLLKNLDLENGLANGSRGVVKSFVGEVPIVQFLNGQERLIDYDIWEVEENDKPILRATQLPLKIAYAISIHKSQGESLDYAEMDLSHVFEYGQAYVALSRIKSLEGLSIIDIDYDKIKSHPKALEFYENHK